MNPVRFNPLIALLVSLSAALALSACTDEANPVGAEMSAPEAAAQDAPPAEAVSGLTQAPDLLSVDNFRKGDDVNGSGTRDTYVDFTFDQPATIASCCAGFQLVPTNGGEPLTALADVGDDGATTLTFAFEGKVKAKDIARGTVDKNIVQVEGEGSETNNPPQAAAVSNNGNTSDPDLVAVTRDGDQLLFEFDEPLTSEDVIQNTSGLRFYTAEAQTYASSDVKARSETTLSAIYDLPEGVTLEDAVGGFVVANTVADDESDDNVNELDEAAPIGDTGATVCAAAPQTGQTGDGSGLTEAPDLLEAGNFRRGPFTDDYEPTTCVDFVFDQEAYLNGGTRSNFNLVPLDASDALPGSTNIEPEADEEGDVVVTVIFPGDLSAENYARGYVDSGVVNSDCCNASAENPYNINQAAELEPNTLTENPDLVSVKRDGDSFLFKFDEALTPDDVAQNTSGFRLYFPEAKQQSTIPFADSDGVDVVDDRTLRVFYNTYPADYTAADAVGGYVVQGAVQAAQGSRGGNDGANAFDEVAPVTTLDATVCEPAPETGQTGDGSGPTEAPDLLEVGNFREGPRTSQFEPTTCVDFVFDQEAFLNGGDRSNFQLVPLDASDALDGSTNLTPDGDQPGDIVVTVIFEGDLSPADFARGYVDTGVVNSAENNISADNPLNINQAANIAPNTLTENPDLAQDLNSVERQSEVWLYFVFDEPLTDDDIVQSTSGLRVYFPATSQSSTIPDAGAVKVKRVNETTLRAKFKDLPEGYRLRDAVGAFVVQGTVQAAEGSRGGNDGKSAFDETFLNIDWPGSR